MAVRLYEFYFQHLSSRPLISPSFLDRTHGGYASVSNPYASCRTSLILKLYRASIYNIGGLTGSSRNKERQENVSLGVELDSFPPKETELAINLLSVRPAHAHFEEKAAIANAIKRIKLH